jgi:hypothetical protein
MIVDQQIFGQQNATGFTSFCLSMRLKIRFILKETSVFKKKFDNKFREQNRLT